VGLFSIRRGGLGGLGLDSTQFTFDELRIFLFCHEIFNTGHEIFRTGHEIFGTGHEIFGTGHEIFRTGHRNNGIYIIYIT
jgi:hypothetical protein